MKPKVTIIMATYNRAHFIVETLESIINQSYTDWECLIIDDGGTDNTKEVIHSIIESDNRFHYLLRPEKYSKGLPGCRNYGLDFASGEFVIFFDDDDIVHPDNLKTCLAILKNETIDFCHYQKQPYYNQKPVFEVSLVRTEKKITINDIEEVIMQRIGLASCTVMWKKQSFNQIRFNEKLLYAEEWECYCRLICKNLNGIMIDTILYYNRKHPNSNTGEFFSNDPIRRQSYSQAILLVLQNIKKELLLSTRLKRYFIILSKDFEEYNLFEEIITVMQLSKVEKMKWNLFFKILPLRLMIHKIKNGLQN